jgi:hypothetical protein
MVLSYRALSMLNGLWVRALLFEHGDVHDWKFVCEVNKYCIRVWVRWHRAVFFREPAEDLRVIILSLKDGSFVIRLEGDSTEVTMTGRGRPTPLSYIFR